MCVSVAVRSELWSSLLSAMKLDAAQFIDKHLEVILPRLLEANTDNQVRFNVPQAFIMLHTLHTRLFFSSKGWNSFLRKKSSMLHLFVQKYSVDIQCSTKVHKSLI